MDSKDLSFAIFASQQTSEGVKLTNLTTSILKLKGSVSEGPGTNFYQLCSADVVVLFKAI